MIQSLGGWSFFDPTKDELGEVYPRRTIAVNFTKASGKYTIVCYDFPKGNDFRVEVSDMDMSGKLATLDEAFEFVKVFKEKGSDAFASPTMNAFGGATDMEVTLDLNHAGDVTRNGKMIDFKKELDRMRQQW